MVDDGYIKFNCKLLPGREIPRERLEELNLWRDKMFSLGLIGIYPNGIGFGNISKRDRGNIFAISGSATGGVPKLSQEHYCIVTSYDFARNSLVCEGRINASSESLTHASLYEESRLINGIIHIHNKEMWGKMLDRVPTTRREVAYGTPEMAEEMKRLFRETDVLERRVLVMAGHEEGIIGFGKDLREAGENILYWHKMLGIGNFERAIPS